MADKNVGISANNSRKPLKERYDSLDGLRAYSAIGIVLLHVYANGGYTVENPAFETVILSFTNLVFLFMIVSGFAMCCGYYEKFINNRVDLKSFYSKRFAKVWPFFAILSILEYVISPSQQAAYETFLNLTLCFGFLPNVNFSVIGVGWFLGVVFVFYFVFPFFCYLLSDRKRAWLAFAAALATNRIASLYFFATRSNFAYSAVFFLAGGMIYLHRHNLQRASREYRWIVITLCITTVTAYFIDGPSVPMMLLMYSSILLFALGISKPGLLVNPVVKFLSNISLEIYLCHMVVFRVLEKLKLTYLFGNNVFSYITTGAMAVLGAVGFSCAVNWCIGKAALLMGKVQTMGKKD